MSVNFPEALTFDDILLLPGHSSVLPRDVVLKTRLTRTITLPAPILSAAMDTVTEARLAIALAQEGGLGIIHKNMSIEEQVKEVRQVKKFESGIVKNPITVSPDLTVQELLTLTTSHRISGVPVVENEKLIGIVTNRDVRFEKDLNKKIAQLMTPKERLITVREGAQREEVIAKLHEYKIEKVLVVNDRFELRGLITAKDIQKAKEKPFACKDDAGQLRVGAAVGIGKETDERVEALVSAGVDLLTVDTAHGHAQGVLDRVRWIKKHFPDAQVMAGNIATKEAAEALVEMGADAVKVGIGPGSICTTRIVTGVGVPQVTAIMNVLEGVKGHQVPVISDGGIRYSGDLCKALAIGADAVMIGGLFAGVEEAPGEVELFQGRTYKSYRGMGSIGAMAQGASDRYFQHTTQEAEKLVPEGIEGRVPYKGALTNVLQQLLGGLRSGMGYTGSETIEALHKKARFVRVTAAGMRESHVHDVTITKEPPNYQVER